MDSDSEIMRWGDEDDLDIEPSFSRATPRHATSPTVQMPGRTADHSRNYWPHPPSAPLSGSPARSEGFRSCHDRPPTPRYPRVDSDRALDASTSQRPARSRSRRRSSQVRSRSSSSDSSESSDTAPTHAPIPSAARQIIDHRASLHPLGMDDTRLLHPPPSYNDTMRHTQQPQIPYHRVPGAYYQGSHYRQPRMHYPTVQNPRSPVIPPGYHPPMIQVNPSYNNARADQAVARYPHLGYPIGYHRPYYTTQHFARSPMDPGIHRHPW